MNQKVSTRIVALAVELLLVTAGFACKRTQPPRQSAPPPNYNAQTSTESTFPSAELRWL
jgi:hypothetical protein